jgi:hypothetical protein
MWWNSVVKLWEYQCRSVFRCPKEITAELLDYNLEEEDEQE